VNILLIYIACGHLTLLITGRIIGFEDDDAPLAALLALCALIIWFWPIVALIGLYKMLSSGTVTYWLTRRR
jgi:hypothetical protein